ncbi:MAG: tetratricopeptide repeat protein [Abditibacteriales bacterium]|nr:tetratricopeptide repeat protein [Abditibacteriales bacterium]MDW8364837.1 tetratricopeptide repeat protein [Abditibacteriales bacterium]
MKQVLLALLAGGLLVAAGVLFERYRSEENAYRRLATSDLLRRARADAQDAVVYWELAQRCYIHNRFTEALTYLKRAQRLRPGWAELFYLEGCVLRQMGRRDEALAPLQRAVKLNPKLAAARFELGLAYNSIGHLKQAIDELRAYVDLEPDDDYGYYWLGSCAMSAGMFDVAERSLQRARALNPQRATTFLVLGNLKLIQNPTARDLEQAMAYYQRAAEIDPTNAEAFALIATVFYRQKRYAEAARAFEHALEIDPTRAEVYYPLGLAYAKIGEKEKSRRCLEIAEIYAKGKEAFARPGGAVAESVRGKP